MGIVELFLIAVGLSMDAFAVAVCKGLAMKKCTWAKAGIVGLYFGVFQAGMPLIGYVLGVQFKDFITSIDHWIAFILLGIIGFNMVRESREEECETASEALAGVKIGNIFGAKYKSKAELAGGIILILMGVKILLEHLGFLG